MIFNALVGQGGLVGDPFQIPDRGAFRHNALASGIPDNFYAQQGSGINGQRGIRQFLTGRNPVVPQLPNPVMPQLPAPKVNGGYGFTAPQDMIGSNYNIPGVAAPTNPYQLPTYTPGG